MSWSLRVHERTLCLRWASLVLIFACGSDAVSEGRACTEVGCLDQLTLTLRATNGWPAGFYAFELTFDDKKHTCAINLPVSLPTDTQTFGALPCEPPLEASFTPQVICSEERQGGGVTTRCTPVQDRWTLHANKSGTPELLRVRVTRDASQVLDVSERPKYEAVRPNGPDCDPVCELSQVEVRLD